jgi:putative membrane protein
MRKVFSFYAILGVMFLTAAALNSYTEAAGNQYSFVTSVGQAGMAEVALANLALSKSQSEDVKQFAQTMIADHSKAGDELRALAAKKNFTFPAEPSAEQKGNAEALASLSGAAFDKAYIQTAIADHEAAVSLFETEAKSGADPDVKAWAAATLSTIKAHLAKAQALNGKIK